MALPLDRFLNAIFVWCIQRIEPDKLNEWRFQLEKPLPGQQMTQASAEQDMEAFAAFAGAFGVSAPQPG